jgi:methylaspartate mutase sigma subunit
MEKKKLITGVLVDIHNLGLRVLEPALTQADFEVIYIGARLSQEDFIHAALETDADAVLVSSSNGHAEIDAKGMREKCQEAGLEDILLYIGGNLVVGQQQREWSDVHELFKRMKFDRVYPTSVLPQEIVKDLCLDLGISET